MPVFTYSAKTADGKTVKGSLRAKDKTGAQEEIRKKRLTPVLLSEQRSEKKGLFGPPAPRVKTKDIAVMTRQLATMIAAGIPILESFDILYEQAEDKGWKIAMDKIIDKMRSGSDFSTALSQYPKQFTMIYLNMVKAGEASGQLDTILNRLAEFLEKAEALKREIKSAMTYPVVAIVLVIGITVGLMVGVVPKFKEIFTTLGDPKQLPMPTQILLATSDFMVNNFLYLLLIIAAIITSFFLYIKTKNGRKQFHWALLHMPVFGILIRKIATARFARTFSTLLSSGVPMLQALEIVSGTIGNVLIEDAIKKARERVIRGDPLGPPLEETKQFPPMVTRMVGIGEKTGALEKLLNKLADFYESEVDTMVEGLTSLIEPLLISFMGVMVGGIVLAIFLPIIKVQQMLSKKGKH